MVAVGLPQLMPPTHALASTQARVAIGKVRSRPEGGLGAGVSNEECVAKAGLDMMSMTTGSGTGIVIVAEQAGWNPWEKAIVEANAYDREGCWHTCAEFL